MLGRRLSHDGFGVVGMGGFLSIMSDVDERRMLGGVLIDKNGELVCERE